jgi:hypothetical protein
MLDLEAMTGTIGVFVRTCLGASLLALSPACSKVSEASSGADQAATPAPPSAPAASNANYSASLEILGSCRSGQQCTVRAVVVARGDYHINEKYPYKFVAQDPPHRGVTYPKKVVGREDSVLQEKKAVLVVPFVADGAGERTVGGTLSLSVCSTANCLMDKQPLETTVKVE